MYSGIWDKIFNPPQQKKKNTIDDYMEKQGIVLIGCDKPQEWINGIMKLLEDEAVATRDDFDVDDHFVNKVGKRNDVLIPFSKTIDAGTTGKLAMWRLKFGPKDCKWIQDYFDNGLHV